MKWFYDILYRYFRAPWDIGPRQELVTLVESRRFKPCRTIDLGSGTASNCVFLAQHGYDVTGVDYSAAAIELGRKRAQQAGVSVNFIVDDLTKLSHVDGTFDLLVDYGALHDLSPDDRDLYLRNVLQLTHPGTRFLLYTFEYELRWWERLLLRLAFFSGGMALEPGEVEQRFSEYFDIERIAGKVDYSRWPAGYAAYLMTRNQSPYVC
jgi:SAM-dependent methyltransferase